MAVRGSASSAIPTSHFSQIIGECGALEKALEVSDTDPIVSGSLIETLKRIKALVSLFNLGWQALLKENAALVKQFYSGIEIDVSVEVSKLNKSQSEGSLTKLSEITLLTQSKLQEVQFINAYLKFLQEKNTSLLQQKRAWALKSKKIIRKEVAKGNKQCLEELAKAKKDFEDKQLDLAKEREVNAQLMRQIDDYAQQLSDKDREIQKLKDRIADLTSQKTDN